MLLLLHNAELYAPEPGGVRHVLVAGERVAAVLDEPPELTGVEIEEVDLDGRRVIPGLVDGHVHVTGGGGEAGYHTRVPAPPLSTYTTAGVTTVVGLLGTDDLVRTTAELLARVRALRVEGLSAWCLTGGYHLPPTTLTGSVTGDLVHLGPVLGVGEIAISDHRSSQPDLADLVAVAAEVHVGALMSGKSGVVHLHLGAGAARLDLVRRAIATSELPSRLFHPTHVNVRGALFDDACDLARETDVVVDVTAFPGPVAEAGDGPDRGTGDDELTAAAAVGRWLDAGLPVERLTVSSDAGGSIPSFDARGRVVGLDTGRCDELAATLAALLHGGRALADVLPAFTATPAAHFGLARKGRLAAGHDADLVVLGEDDRPTDVLARGRWMVRDGRPEVWGTFDGGQAPHGGDGTGGAP